MKKDINITEVAKRAGVSIATVSRVINNNGKVKLDTRKKIEAIIEETGYRPNRLARELAEKRTRLIGIITHSIIGEGIPSSIYGISEYVEKENFNIMIACTNGDLASERKNFDMFQSKRVEGILFYTRKFTDEHADMINRLPFPVIVMLQKTNNPDIPAVVFDNYAFASAATERLIELGHRSIVFLGGPKESVNSSEREQGYSDALKKASLQVRQDMIFHGDYSIDDGYQMLARLLKKDLDFTAVVAANDGMAIGAINCLIENNYAVPTDISVIGLDDTTLAKASRPPLSAVFYSYRQLGESGASLLLAQISQESVVEQVVIPYQIKMRASTAQVKKEG